jgi:hypothetical protein
MWYGTWGIIGSQNTTAKAYPCGTLGLTLMGHTDTATWVDRWHALTKAVIPSETCVPICNLAAMYGLGHWDTGTAKYIAFAFPHTFICSCCPDQIPSSKNFTKFFAARFIMDRDVKWAKTSDKLCKNHVHITCGLEDVVYTHYVFQPIKLKCYLWYVMERFRLPRILGELF